MSEPITDKDYVDVLKQLHDMKNCAEMLWTVVANVSESDWSKQSEEWQEAAKKWRDVYFDLVAPKP